MARVLRKPACHPNEPHAGKGLCRKCYARQWNKARTTSRKKATCHPNLLEASKGKCARCIGIERFGEKEYLARGAKRQKDYVARLKGMDDKTKYNKLRESGRKSTLRSALMRDYKLTEDDVKHMLVAQDNKCALCYGPPPAGKQLSIDHCHTTGNVRGMLCVTCNTFLSRVDADHSIVDRLLPYALRASWRK